MRILAEDAQAAEDKDGYHDGRCRTRNDLFVTCQRCQITEPRNEESREIWPA